MCAPCTAETTDLAEWLQVASDLLFELSGRQFSGLCSDTVRPCSVSCANDGPPHYDELVEQSSWTWRGVCACADQCGCTSLPELVLTGWPLIDITEILIDGAVLDPTAYRVDNWSRLVRVDGEQWPACQDLALATTEPDTFQIEFTYGRTIPLAGQKAAASLGCQLALACAGDSSCRLPQRVQSITRQGVSMVLLDPFTFFDDGRTGLYDVDLFLAAYGPTAKKRWPPLVVNPDRHRRVRRTTS